MTDKIDSAFGSYPQLRKRIYDAIRETPQHETLFQDIAQHHLSLQQSVTSTNGAYNQPVEQHPSKKRRLDADAIIAQPDLPREVVVEVRDVSFSIPQRKKFHLGIVQYGKESGDHNLSYSIQGRNPATNEVEFEYPAKAFAYALRLPVPEKTQKQYNYCLLPSLSKPTGAPSDIEPLVWTVNHGPLRSYSVHGTTFQAIGNRDADRVLDNCLKHVFEKTGTEFIEPDEKEFSSATRESHRKNDVAYHVKAHKGSKEGYLFFLSHGIFFGFKKPLLFFSFPMIHSISYTSVLQRTFNLNISIRQNEEDDNSEPEEYEFSMLDQVDFAGIDKYIKTHALHDASLAEARRAKLKSNNKSAAAKGATNDGTTATNGKLEEGDEEDDRTELEKAQQELEDEEDEMEEDYDPDEDGDSDDSGSGSDEEEDYDDGNNARKKGKKRDLVADELGSEAEDVSVTEDEEEDEDEDAEGEEEEMEEVEDHPPASTAVKEEKNGTSLPVSKVPSRVVPVDPHAPALDDEDQL